MKTVLGVACLCLCHCCVPPTVRGERAVLSAVSYVAPAERNKLPRPLGTSYQHLPAEALCAAMYKLCEDDCRHVVAQMELVSGWQRRQLVELRCEAERLRAIWYAAWWISWKDAQQAQQHEWADILVNHIGLEAFWRAEVPLPLSLR
jgi:hypothetical protein